MMSILDHLRAAAEAQETATPGPWRWCVNEKFKNVSLASASGIRPTVMDFVRYGMSNAAPRFFVNGLLERADVLSATVPGREHHASWHKTIDHPDAKLIAAAGSIPFAKVLAVVEAAAWRAEVAAAMEGGGSKLVEADLAIADAMLTAALAELDGEA